LFFWPFFPTLLCYVPLSPSSPLLSLALPPSPHFCNPLETSTRRSDTRAHALMKIQKYTSGLTARTERNLAEKAGHLEMLAGGKGRKKGGEGKKGEEGR